MRPNQVAVFVDQNIDLRSIFQVRINSRLATKSNQYTVAFHDLWHILKTQCSKKSNSSQCAHVPSFYLCLPPAFHIPPQEDLNPYSFNMVANPISWTLQWKK